MPRVASPWWPRYNNTRQVLIGDSEHGNQQYHLFSGQCGIQRYKIWAGERVQVKFRCRGFQGHQRFKCGG